MKDKIYIASCSFGKDSLATILLALEHNEPLDRVVFSEVMFDIKNNISGEQPEHIEWIYDVAIPKLKQMGVHVDIARSDDRDYKYFFKKKRQSGKFIGKVYGFPISGRCFINSDCKLRTIRKYMKQFKDRDIIQYIGVAVDEPKRLLRLKTNHISLLAKYGYTEQMAYDLCKKNNLLSPIYDNATRGGCWFCPNCSIREFINLRRNHADLWDSLKELSNTPDLLSDEFRYGKSFKQIEHEMDKLEDIESRQLSLF